MEDSAHRSSALQRFYLRGRDISGPRGAIWDLSPRHPSDSESRRVHVGSWVFYIGIGTLSVHEYAGLYSFIYDLIKVSLMPVCSNMCVLSKLDVHKIR